MSGLFEGAATRKLVTGENKIEDIEAVGRTVLLSITFKDDADVEKFKSDLKKELDVEIVQSIDFPEELLISRGLSACVVLGRASDGRIALRAGTSEVDTFGESSAKLLDKIMWSKTLSDRMSVEGPWKGIANEVLEMKLSKIAPLGRRDSKGTKSNSLANSLSEAHRQLAVLRTS